MVKHWQSFSVLTQRVYFLFLQNALLVRWLFMATVFHMWLCDPSCLGLTVLAFSYMAFTLAANREAKDVKSQRAFLYSSMRVTYALHRLTYIVTSIHKAFFTCFKTWQYHLDVSTREKNQILVGTNEVYHIYLKK